MWEYQQPVRILFGPGTLSQLGDEIKSMGGRRGLLVTSPGFVRRGLAKQIVNQSSGLLIDIFSHVSPNPTVDDCDACCQVLRRQKCDFVVAVGGGSVMDCAKAAATLSLQSESSTAYVGTGKALPQGHLPLIAVPTTAGTGSEITCVAVLSDHRRGVKVSFSGDGLYPRLAIVDPELTYTVPPYLTACTGFDVICHATEAYWSLHHQPVCDTLAVHAMKLALGHLLEAFDRPDDHEARQAMAEASVTAGLAFTLPKTSAPHACSYPLTNMLGIPHGEACILTMPLFIRYNVDGGCRRVDDFARQCGLTDGYALAQHIEVMRQHTGLRSDLRDLHLSVEQVDQLIAASHHPNLRNNPVPVTDRFLHQMYYHLAGFDAAS